MTTAAQTWTSDDFQVDLTRRPAVDVVSVRGELDIATSRRLRDVVLDPQLEHQPTLVVDLSGVTFLDSTGIGVLVATWRRALANGQRFAVVCPAGQPLKVLQLVHIDDLVTIRADLDEALATLVLG